MNRIILLIVWLLPFLVKANSHDQKNRVNDDIALVKISEGFHPMV
jgi:hypothetical protein